MKKLYLVILAFSFTFSWLQGQSDLDLQCGAEPSPEELAYMASFAGMSASEAEDSIVYIAVNYFVGRRSDGSGGLNINRLPELTQQLNDYYINAGVQFYTCGDVNFIDSTLYYDFETTYESEVCGPRDRYGVLNVYFFNTVKNGSGSGLCGYTYFPGSRRDRVVVSNACAFNGSTYVHEVGHFFSLYHTHGKTNSGTTDELVDGSNCQFAGDDVCDTPADPNLNGKVNAACEYTGGASDANGVPFEPDPRNIMSYSRKSCRDYLSPGQYDRVRFSARFHRSYFEPCCSDTFQVATSHVPPACAGEANGQIQIISASGYGPVSYSWSVPGDSNYLDSLSAGTYVAKATDVLGCLATDTVVLADPVVPGADITLVPPHCGINNGSISFSDLRGQGSVQWIMMTGMDTLSNYDSLPAGWYQVQYMDSVGCSAADSIMLVAVDLPRSGLPDTLFRLCASDTLLYPVIELTETSWLAFWMDSSNLIASGQLEGLPMEDGNYSLLVRDTLYGCQVIEKIAIADDLKDIHPAIEVLVSNFLYQLEDRSVPIVDGRKWFVNGTLQDSVPLISGLMSESGWIDLCLEVTNLCGTVSLCDSIWLPGYSILTDVSSPLCAGDAGLIDLQIIGDSVDYFITWMREDGSTGVDLNGLMAGTYVIEVVDQHGSVQRDTVRLTEPDSLMLVNVAIQPSTGLDGSVSIEISGGVAPYGYMWSNGMQEAEITGVAPGEYSCTVTDGNDCIRVFGPFAVPAVSGTREFGSDFHMLARPNIFSEQLEIEFRGLNETGEKYLEVSDLRGRLLKRIKLEPSTGSYLQIDSRDWAAGVYLVSLRSEKAQETIKVIRK